MTIEVIFQRVFDFKTQYDEAYYLQPFQAILSISAQIDKVAYSSQQCKGERINSNT